MTRPMRIAYLVQMAELDAENGVVKKIAAQARTWLAVGHTVQIFSLARSATVWPGLASRLKSSISGVSGS